MSIEPVLHFTRAEYAARLAKTRAAMQRDGYDLLIVSDPANMAWLTGYDGWSFYVHQAVVLGMEGEPVWFGRGMDAKGAIRTCFMAQDNIVGYADEYVQSTEKHPMEVLACEIGMRGWGGCSIGVEMDAYWYSAAAHLCLARNLPKATFRDATAFVRWQRAVKSEAELGYMRKAAGIVERMHTRIRDVAEPGMRKCDLVAEIYDASLRYDEQSGVGGEYPAIVPLLPSGSDAAASHLTWDDAPMKSGEGTFFEIAGVYKRYHCPLSRTLYFGTPPHAFLEAEKAVQEGLALGLEKAVAGNRCEDIAGAFFDVLARYGIKKDSRAGYSIGLAYPPDWGEHTMSLRRGDRTVLEPNMTFHFMTGLWMDDWGFELTESIVIGDTGAECLADVPRALVVK